MPNGKNPEFFNEKSLDVLEYQGESGTGHIYYRISKIYNLQKVYDFYENIKQYKDLDYEMFLFLDAQYDFLKQQKAIKKHMTFYNLDNKSVEHFINILKKQKHEAN